MASVVFGISFANIFLVPPKLHWSLLPGAVEIALDEIYHRI